MFDEPSHAYRSRMPCPACAAEMEHRDLAEVQIEVCPACASVFLDWADGDPRELASEAQAIASAAGGTEGSRAVDAGVRAHGSACPKCQGSLGREEVSNGALLFRCSHCLGAFLTAPMVEALRRVHAGSNDDMEPAQRNWLARLQAALARLLDLS